MSHAVLSDRWRLAWWIMLLQGLASSIPWNVYVTESEFFDLRTHQEPTQMQLADNFETIELLVVQFAMVIGFVMYIPFQDHLSMDLQVLHPQMVTLAIMVVSVVMTVAPHWSGSVVIWLSLASQAALGLTNATICGGIMSMASWLPSPYVQGMSLGIGWGNVGVALLSFVTLWATPRDPHAVPLPADVAPAAFAYFLGSALVVAFSIGAYLLFFYLPYVQHHSLPPGMLQPPYQLHSDAHTAQQHSTSVGGPRAAAAASASMRIPRPPITLQDAAQSHCAGTPTPPGTPSLGLSRKDSANFLRSKSFSERSRHAALSDPSQVQAVFLPSPASSPLLEGGPNLAPLTASLKRPPSDAALAREGSGPLGAQLSGEGSLLGRVAAGDQEGSRPGSCSSLISLGVGPNGVGANGGGPSSPGDEAEAEGHGIEGEEASTLDMDRSWHGSEGAGVRQSLLPRQPSRQLSVPASHASDAWADLSGARAEDMGIGTTLRLLFWWNVVAVLSSAVTLTVFPGVTSAICSIRNSAVTSPCTPYSPAGRFYGDLFVPFGFVLFNGSDLLGRVVAGLPPWDRKPPHMAVLVLYTLARIPMAAVLLFCHVVTSSPWRLPLIFRSDWLPLGFVALLGFTGGHQQSLLYMHSPQALPRRMRDRCGPVISFALTLGYTAGSVISFLVMAALQDVR